MACLGGLFLAVGGIGVIVPGLPTVVFWIIAAWCFGTSCPALQRWIYNRPHLGPVIEQFANARTLSRTSKRRALIGMWLGMLTSAVIIYCLSQPLWIVGMIMTAGLCVSAWIRLGIRISDPSTSTPPACPGAVIRNSY